LPAYRLPSPYDRQPLWRRASGLALAVAINLGLLFLILGMGKFAPIAKRASETLTVELLPEAKRENQKTEQLQQVHEQTPRQPKLKKPPIVLPSRPTITPLPWIEMSKEEYAATDISKMAKAATGSSSGSPGDSEEVGRGPRGEVLYAAEWVREPTDAEINGYMPANAQAGIGVIACKTVPGNRVDNCYEVGESPLGSHLARGLRQAAWQFHIRPPRKNGVPMIGEWVRIHLEYHIRAD
jgi:protein TonB